MLLTALIGCVGEDKNCDGLHSQLDDGPYSLENSSGALTIDLSGTQQTQIIRAADSLAERCVLYS